MSESNTVGHDPLGPEGLPRLLEDLYLVGREQVESSILAHLLRHDVYRAAFLRHCGIQWPPGTHAVARCEVSLDEGGRADVVVTWSHQGERRLLIEHKLGAPFTPDQPQNYVRHLKKTAASHAAFVLIARSKDRKDEATRRILRSRVVPASSGSSWTNIESHLRSARRSRLMRFRVLPALARDLALVDGPPLHRALVEFWRSRHDDAEVEVPEADQLKVRELHATLRIKDDEPQEGSEHYGFHLWYDGKGRHAERLWLGVEPPVAKQMGVGSGRLLLIQGGYLPGKQSLLLETWMGEQGLTWQGVQSGEELAERAVALPETEVDKALDASCTRLKLQRTRRHR